MFQRLRTRALLPFLALLAAACSAGQADHEDLSKPRLGLFTSIPLYWGEGEIGTFIDGEGKSDWVRAELETRFELVPLDTLEQDALAGLDRVILAQPRPLAPSENVAFDRWVAEGGRAVILADPMLTRHTRYPIGDRRRPQDVVLLSPILSRWGVELQFDEDQPGGERMVEVDGRGFPVNLRGRFIRKDTGAADRACQPMGDALFARCVRGRGSAFLYADAAVLDWEGAGSVPSARRDALWHLLRPLMDEQRGLAQPDETADAA